MRADEIGDLCQVELANDGAGPFPLRHLQS